MKYQTEYMRKFQSTTSIPAETIGFDQINKNVNEPGLQRKKRVQINHQPLKLTDGSNVDIFSGKKIERIKPMLLEDNKLSKSVVKDDQFILLGPQDKFSTVNLVPYRLRVPVNKSISELVKSVNKPTIEEIPDNKNKVVVPNLEINQENKSKPVSKTTKIKSPSKGKTQVIKKEIKQAPRVEIDTGKIAESIIDQAILNKPIRNIPMTEYQKSFIWSTQSKPSAVVDASVKIQQEKKEQNELKTVANEEKLVEPTESYSNQKEKKTTKNQFVTEYKSNFADLKQPVQKIILRKEVSEPKVVDDSRLPIHSASNPQKPFGPHGKLRRWKSEYQMSFKPYSAEAAKSSIEFNPKPNQDAKEPSEWFKNIIELRKKAEEYKKRTYGLNFSSEHMAQVKSNNLSYWDIQSTDSDSEKSKLSNIKERHIVKRSLSTEPKIQITEVVKEKKQEPVEEKKEIVISPKEPKTPKAAEVVITKVEDKKLMTEIVQPSKTNNLSTHVFRQVDNLNSDHVKLHMNWDDFESPRDLNANNSSQLVDRHLNILNEAKEKLKAENLSKSHGEKKKPSQIEAQKKTNVIKKNHNSKPEQPKHPQHYKTIEIKETYYDYDQNKNHVTTLTYDKPKDDDLDSISQLSSRSLASSSSLLERAKENKDKIWGKH